MIKDPLDYSETELNSLSNDELLLLLNVASEKEGLFNTEQTVLKLMINSLYGALGNKWFPLFNEDIACAITGNGRYFIRKLSNYIENTLQKMHKSDKKYIIYGDTDSIYFTVAPFMNMFIEKNPGRNIDFYVDWADNFEKKVIQPTIKQCISDFANELNAIDSDIIGAEREVIADRFVITNKKKYFCRVRDSEGTRYPENDPYIKVMGLDIIKGGTPVWSKKYLREAIPYIFDSTETELRDWLKLVKQKFVSSELVDIAIVGGVSRLDYDINAKGVPMGSRAAIRHNMYIEKHNLSNNIANIQPGDKTKRIFLTTPNKFDTNVIAFTNESFIKELDGIVDYDLQFMKGFLKPLELMTNCLKYNLEKETESLYEW